MIGKKILIVDDEVMIRRVLSEALSEWRYVPIQAENIQSALTLLDSEQPALTLLDINLSDGSGLDALQAIRLRQPDALVVVITGNILTQNVSVALRAGACDFITKPINLDKLQAIISRCLEIGEPFLEKSPLKISSADFSFKSVIGESSVMKGLLSLVRKIAESDVSSVLLQGESGTGKDLIAKTIHYSSTRAVKPFVAINCAAIPAHLIESELFGYEKGAFTDAKTLKQGLFEQADGGTIFLDEIGEIDASTQVKLLRVISEERAFERVGGSQTLRADVRLIAATNKNLETMVSEGKFRDDLYFRLNVVKITMPPLRARKEDIPLLVRSFLRHFSRANERPVLEITADAMNALLTYEWPGNVRELRTAIEHGVVMATGAKVTLRDLPAAVRQAVGATLPVGISRTKAFEEMAGPLDLHATEQRVIMQALATTKGNITAAAKKLGISRRTLHRKINEMNEGKSEIRRSNSETENELSS